MAKEKKITRIEVFHAVEELCSENKEYQYEFVVNDCELDSQYCYFFSKRSDSSVYVLGKEKDPTPSLFALHETVNRITEPQLNKITTQLNGITKRKNVKVAKNTTPFAFTSVDNTISNNISINIDVQMISELKSTIDKCENLSLNEKDDLKTRVSELENLVNSNDENSKNKKRERLTNLLLKLLELGINSKPVLEFLCKIFFNSSSI